MSKWTAKMFIYEINTAVWLADLSRQYQQEITLANVPDEVLDELANMGVNTIWLMGIWQRSVAARQSALNYMHEYRPVLPDLTEEDVIGSAYAIGRYEVDARWGGRDALASLRQRLQNRELHLILDYVPNHVAVDHPWVTENPHYMVRGTKEAVKKNPGIFFKTTNAKGQELIIAHGRDPHFPAWIDTAQVNAFSPDYRRAARDTLLDIASQCDGVRCDMAMLLVNDVFARTWGDYLPETAPKIDFWEEIIPAIKHEYPDFVFGAEVYWDMEYELQRQGFDYTLDKRLYDRLHDTNVSKLREHLWADLGFQQKMIRFIENHDEQRAVATLNIEKSRTGAVMVCTLPGAVLLHDGQFTGRVIKLPMQIGRQPQETPNYALRSFYHRLIAETRHPVYHHGTWRLLDISSAYEELATHNNLLAYSWEMGDEFRLIVVNLTPFWSQGLIYLNGWHSLGHNLWRLEDTLSGSSVYRDGDNLLNDGIYIEMEPYQSKILLFERVEEHEQAIAHRLRAFSI